MSMTSGTCAVCEKPAKGRCVSCNSVFYCGKEHQKEHWRQHKTHCKACKVEVSPDHGRIVVSTRTIKEGDVIVSEEPLIFGPHYKWDQPDFCLGCYQLTPVMSRCSQCNSPICSLACPGIRDPFRHGAECFLLKKIEVPLFEKSYILPLRCLLLQKTDPSKWAIFLEMAEHAVNVKPTHPSRESRIVFEESILKPLSRKAPELLPGCSKETVRKVYNVLDMFGLYVDIPDFGPLVALCPVASLMEHSCLPNSRRFVDIRLVAGKPWSLRLVVRATQAIPPAGNISTLFTDTWMCSYARQDNLRSRRNAACRCGRCSDPTELGTNFGTLRCRICSGWMLPVNPPDVDLCDWKCEICGHVYSPLDVKVLLCGVQNEMAACRVHEGPDNVEKYEALLVRLQQDLHPNHHYCLLCKGAICDYFDYLVDVWQSTLPETVMTMPQLDRTGELCRDLISVLEHHGVVTQEIHGPKLSECLRQLASVNTEIAKRKRMAGIWTSDEANKAIQESKNALRKGAALRNSVFDHSSTQKHDDVELLKKLIISRGRNNR